MNVRLSVRQVSTFSGNLDRFPGGGSRIGRPCRTWFSKLEPFYRHKNLGPWTLTAAADSCAWQVLATIFCVQVMSSQVPACPDAATGGRRKTVNALAEPHVSLAGALNWFVFRRAGAKSKSKPRSMKQFFFVESRMAHHNTTRQSTALCT